MELFKIIIPFVCVCLLHNAVECIFIKTQTPNTRVCVIGAGIAGLASARYLKEEGLNFTVLEATQYVGGTWRYDPRVGTDENGLPLFTSMYKHLRTNLPKQAMELRGFPVPQNWPSFPSWTLYYEYLQRYAKHFDVEKYIKFLHIVISVRKEGNIWKVKHKNVISEEEFVEEYEYVFVCNGHHSIPHFPDIPGEQLFKGTIIHSHDFRDPEVFKDRRVLVVGAGPSGMDIGLDVAEVASKLVHSQHLTKIVFKTPFPKNWKTKPDVKEFNETGAIFNDGSYEDIDDVIYCTGFQFSYPFLDETSGLTLNPKYVLPLYNYMVNIQEPTMVLMGLVVRACIVVAIDAQARYATALVKGNFTLPPKEEMLREWQSRADVVHKRSRPMSDIHLLAEKEDQYYAAIANESGTDRVPPVYYKIRLVDTEAKLRNLYSYRNYAYDIIDENTFTRRYEEPRSLKCCTP